MDETPDFADRKAAQAWLRGQPPAVSVTIATRAVLRVVPLIEEIFSEDEKAEVAILSILRATLTASVAALGPTDAVRNAARSAADAASAALSAVALSAADSAFAAADAARAAAFSAASDADAYLAYASAAAATDSIADYSTDFAAADYATASTSTAAYDAATYDATTAATEQMALEKVFDSPVWNEAEIPNGIATHWSRLRTQLENRGPNWRFWIDWYESHLRGGEKNWPLLTRIALIPHDDWQQGPAHVNAIIRAILAEFEPVARDRTRQTMQNVEAVLGERFQIGGNFPPEPLGDPAYSKSVLENSLRGLRAALQKLRAWLYDNALPDRQTVESCLKAIHDGIIAIVVWCGGKADLAVDTAIKSGIPALGADFALRGQASVLAKLHAVANEWVMTLPY